MSNTSTSLYNFQTNPSVASKNLTTLYTAVPSVNTDAGYGNANVEAFLNAGTDGGNSVQNIVANGNITLDGDLNVGGESNLGDISNVHIDGGTVNYVISTDGTGNLAWVPQVDNAGNTIPYLSFVAQTDGPNQQFANVEITKYFSNLSMNVFRNGINIEPTQYIKASPNTLQILQFLNAGDTIDILSTNSGSNITIAGNVTEVQYNGGNILSSTPLFTYTPGGQILRVPNLSVSGNLTVANVIGTTGNIATFSSANANIGNLTVANFTLTSVTFGNATIGNANIANITSNVTFTNEVNLGPVGNVHITGGTNGYVLSTDGAGNLSWVVQSGGGGNGTPGGSNTQVQFNNAGAFGGNSTFTFNSSNSLLTVGNISTANLTATSVGGNGSRLTGLTGANVTGTVASAAQANTANLATAANVAYSVAGANVTGIVANANFASFANSASFVSGTVANATHANVADLANSVAGSNVVGTVANANYSAFSGVAASANSVAVANVTGIGNIAVLNLTGSASNVLYGNGVFAPVSANINANYANFAGNAFSVTGSNVVGPVASATNAATVTTAAQPNITSTGTLTSLTVSGNANIGSFLSVANTATFSNNISVTNTVSGNLGNFNNAELGNTRLFKFQEGIQSVANTGTSITPNVTFSTIFQYVANSNFTFNGLANAVAGTSATVIIQQDSTGGRTMTSTMKFAGGSKTLSTTANSIDLICLFYDGVTYYAALSKGYA